MKCDHACLLIMPSIILFAFAEVQGQNFLRNSGFEAFTNGEPAGWVTSNIPGMLILVSQSKEAHGGKSGIRLEVKMFYGTAMAGTATQEDIPATTRRVRLSGFYRLKSVGGDNAFVNVCLINENGSTIGVENLTLGPASSFKEFSIPLETREENTVVKAKVCIAIIAGNKDQLHEGTVAIFDDIVLKASTDEEKAIGEIR